jgi:hypothetical protein
MSALTKRHLTSPPNRALPLRYNVFVDHPDVRRAFVEAYHHYLSCGDLDAWKHRRTLPKLALIERSKALDKMELCKIDAFVKREVCATVPKKARMIQGNVNEATAYAHPEHYYAVGYALKQVGNLDFDLGGVRFTLVYASGKSHDELSDLVTEWLGAPGIVLFDERDGKNWDATMQEETLRAEASVYALVDEALAQAHLTRSARARARVVLKQCAPHIIKYITSWKRLSGDWNTSVGNTIISMIICVLTIVGLPTALRPDSVFGIDCGGGAPRSRKAIPGSKQAQETGCPVRPTCKQHHTKRCEPRSTRPLQDGTFHVQ